MGGHRGYSNTGKVFGAPSAPYSLIYHRIGKEKTPWCTDYTLRIFIIKYINEWLNFDQPELELEAKHSLAIGVAQRLFRFRWIATVGVAKESRRFLHNPASSRCGLGSAPQFLVENRVR